MDRWPSEREHGRSCRQLSCTASDDLPVAGLVGETVADLELHWQDALSTTATTAPLCGRDRRKQIGDRRIRNVEEELRRLGFAMIPR